VLEVRWLAVARRAGEGLVDGLDRLNRLYGSRRLMHPFSAFNGPAGDYNCTQCGCRNSLTAGSMPAKSAWDRSGKDKRFRPRELLCVSCAAKRARKIDAQQSTREIAMAPMRSQILQSSELTERCQELLDQVFESAGKDGLSCDGIETSVDKVPAEIFARGELAEVFEDNIGPDGLLDREAKRTDAAQSRLIGWLGDNRLPASDWFAVLMADGDQMGAWFSGRSIPELRDDDNRYLAHQVAVGNAVQTAASSINTIIEEHHGAVVYTGGDDVLALLPAVQAFSCASKIREAFRIAFSSIRDARGRQPTLSAGLCLAHVKEPLRLVLTRARKAEHEAKEVWGRDAVVVATMLPSGTHCSVGGKWQAVASDPTPVAELLDDLVERRRQGHISGGFFPDMCDVLPGCFSHQQGAAGINDTGRAMIEALATRLLRRRRPDEHRSSFKDQELDEMAHRIAELARDHQSMQPGINHLDNLTGLLRTAAVIMRKEA
jgi:hypothetical protein